MVGTVTLVLGVLPELRALRAQIADELPRFGLERFDKLEQYTLALNHANALHRSTLPTRANMAELGAELVESATGRSRMPWRSRTTAWWMANG